eukprot:6186992-Pleurochrysis_carterae.AAC.1
MEAAVEQHSLGAAKLADELVGERMAKQELLEQARLTQIPTKPFGAERCEVARVLPVGLE